MTAIDTSLASAANAASANAATKSTADDLSDSFMTLLITQLKNQDPTNPMENAELTSQLAQINTVNGINELNTTMTGITSQIDTGQQLQTATSMIGKGVMVPGNRVLVGNESTTPFGIELISDADTVKATIHGSSGEVVRTFDIGPLDKGVESFSWDGLLDDESVAPDGAYTVSFEASLDGKPVEIAALNAAQVISVKMDGTKAILDLGAVYGQVEMSDVRQVF